MIFVNLLVFLWTCSDISQKFLSDTGTFLIVSVDNSYFYDFNIVWFQNIQFYVSIFFVPFSTLPFLLFSISACYRDSSCTASMIFVVKWQIIVYFGFYLRLLCYIFLKNVDIEFACKSYHIIFLFVLFHSLYNSISAWPANVAFF